MGLSGSEAAAETTSYIRTQFGSAGQVIGDRLTDSLAREGILSAAALAREIEADKGGGSAATAVAQMDDATAARLARQARELNDLREGLERSREKAA